MTTRFRFRYSQRVIRLLRDAANAALHDVRQGFGNSEALCEKIKDTLYYQWRDGHCTHEEMHAALDLRGEVYHAWPEHSGNSAYPVPAPGESEAINEFRDSVELSPVDWDDPAEAAEAYFDAVDGCLLYEGNFYDESDDYGKARLRLLDFVIDTLNKEIIA